ncbi:cation diffusion facilitator family transporter [Loigolactobacillus iwatensis]|uniref:cation diffusion facilitator family transporter n=1 Tax=Loigolactobacillus iwatensis TaxID=1267156 RepID=UPI000F7F9ECC|nr:cation diffusion facilitator family transporter [Loigolactobacillus iwatensis]
MQTGQMAYSKAFKIGVFLNLLFIIIEVGYGVTSNSLALIADAGHNLSDVLGLAVSWIAVWLSGKNSNQRYTYGYKSSSILAALLNAIFLLIAVGGIATEAIQRFNQPASVAGWPVIIVAAIGVLINGFTALLFMSGRKKDLNIKGAFLHMAADAGVSIGVVLAGFLMLVTGWTWLDPLISLLIALLILLGTWGLLRDALNLALAAVPASIDLVEVKQAIEAHPEVKAIHDLHIWAIGTTDTALTVHIVRTELANNNELLENLNQELMAKFAINHVTIQPELGKVTQETSDNCI